MEQVELNKGYTSDMPVSMRKKIKKLFIFLLFYGLFVCVTILGSMVISEQGTRADQGQLEACRWYESEKIGQKTLKALAPERYEILGEETVNSYDWFTSCVTHMEIVVSDTFITSW